MTRDPAILKLLVGVSVLVIDTDPDARELLEAVLGYCGAFVAHAASAREALDIVAKEKPDVVVAEIAMPDADGYWLVERLRARGAGRAIPVVALISRSIHGSSAGCSPASRGSHSKLLLRTPPRAARRPVT